MADEQKFDVRFLVLPLIIQSALDKATLSQKLLIRGRLHPLLDDFRLGGSPHPIFDELQKIMGPKWTIDDKTWAFIINVMPGAVEDARNRVKEAKEKFVS